MDQAIPADLCFGCMQPTGDVAVCPKCGWQRGAPAESPLYLNPGFVLREQYLVGRSLGHGGFGITYLGWDLNLARRIAIKEYFPSGVGIRVTGNPEVFAYAPAMRADYDWGLERYLEEARVVAQFENHPNIVAVKNYFPANGTAYMVLEHLDGITFEEFLARSQGKVSWDIALRVMTPVMDALREVHRVGLLHRDISPDNIFVLWSGQIKVIDFGAARYSLGSHSKNLSVILKPGFAPPEQYETRGDQRPWTDVYAVAATLYRAITGELPLPAPDRRRQPLPTPTALGAEIEPGRERALMQALSLEPEERFATMEAFQRALREEPSVRPIVLPKTEPPPAPAPGPGKGTPPALDAAATTDPIPKPGPTPGPAPPPKPVPPGPGGFPRWLMGVAAGVLVLVAAAVFWPRKQDVPPSIEYFRVDRDSVTEGERAELSWSVRGAESVRIEGHGAQPAAGKLSVSPERTTSYALHAESHGLAADQTVTVTVSAARRTTGPDDPGSPGPADPRDEPAASAAEIVAFTVSPGTVAPNEQAMLTWDVRGAKEVKVGKTVLPPSGSAPVRVQTSTRYTLRATGADGKFVERDVVLTVRAPSTTNRETPKPPVSVSRFEFTPSTVAAGGSARLDWAVTGSTAVRINNRAVAASGSIPVRPTQSLSVELVAEGPGGPIRRTATLTLQPAQSPYQNPSAAGPQITAFAANPVSINQRGQMVTLFYSTRNAVRVLIQPEVGNLTSTQGRVTVFPTGSTQYTITAYAANGQSVSQSVRVSAGGDGRFLPQDQPVVSRNAWRVYHHHGSAILSGAIDFGRGASSGSGCYGTLSLVGDKLTFDSSTNDGFSVAARSIAEVEANRLRLGGKSAFHIKLGSGANYNFVPQYSLNSIVAAIRRAMQ
ncbi:MAG: serine/threonine-protein kinase [Bryobacteraceae bacterium]